MAAEAIAVFQWNALAPRTAGRINKPLTGMTALNPLPINQSLFFRMVLAVNLTARPFARLFGRRYNLNLTEWRVGVAPPHRPRPTPHHLRPPPARATNTARPPPPPNLPPRPVHPTASP